MDKLEQNLANLKILRANLDKIDAGFRKLRGLTAQPTNSDCSPDEFDPQGMKDEIDYLYASINNLRNYAYNIEGALYNYQYSHAENHVPKLNASAMQKFLKNCGMEGDYEIQKPKIYVSAANNTIELNYTK